MSFTSTADRCANVKEQVSVESPVKILVYNSGGEGIFTAGGNNYETVLIELAGGENIFKDLNNKQWATVSYEEVLFRDPDVILIHEYEQPAIEQKIKGIKKHSVLSQLESVKNEKIVSISLESVLPDNRMAYSVESIELGFPLHSIDE